MSVESKTDESIASAYSAALAATSKVDDFVTKLRKALKEQADSVALSAEERRREQDKALYDMEVERRKVVDQQAAEDAAREASFKAKTAALNEAVSELCGLLGINNGAEVPSPKAIRTAFDNAIASAAKAGEGKGAGIAKAAYETQKRIDEALADKNISLLTQSNAQLTARNNALEAQVTELLAQQNQVVGHMKDLGLGALTASAGVQAKANDALAAAAVGSSSNKLSK